MLVQQQLQSFIREAFTSTITQQSKNRCSERNYRPFNFQVDLLETIRTKPNIATIIIGSYPFFVQKLDKTIYDILKQSNIPCPIYGLKIAIVFQNCMIPRHNLKSVEFLTASLNQREGILIYLKDAEIVSVKQNQLYLQSWNEIWQYNCDCKIQSNRIYKKRITQSLLDIITKGSTNNLKQNCKGQNPPECQSCNLNLRFIATNDLIYEQCQQLQVMIQTARPNGQQTKFQIFNNGNIQILMDKYNAGKFKKGDMFDACCFFKSTVQLTKSFIPNNRVSAQINHLIYMVCSYPQSHYLTPQNNVFFSRLRQIQLQQKAVTRIGNINEMIYNYKHFMETVNEIRYPYLRPNQLTAMKLVTLASIFGHQGSREKLNLLILTDEVPMVIKFLNISDLSIKRLPTIWCEKTLSQFFNSCHNSIVMITNPDRREISLINKILKEEIYSNLNFVLWIIAQPADQNINKKIQLKEIDIVLDLTVQKNLNVCESVYVSMIDNFLESFIEDDCEDQFVVTMAKKFNRKLAYDDYAETSMKRISENQTLKQERLANDVLRRYFLKSRQFKKTQIKNVETLTKIAQSFTSLRYFVQNKGFVKRSDNKHGSQRQYLSILDVILAIFIDQETSRNKFSSQNTLFANQVSKIMLNQNNCNVSIWDYEVDGEYVQETKRYIPRDQLVGMVVTKIFALLYDQ